ncbi:O-antigen ligase family protein [Aliagarivorans marinus]|uniref:O-antigen ligase family protein n=1 Tax=Aliagarivorans marinus TaxID=561965 RepID=UPI00040B1F5B|nr:O-antigen ligase family protein [Aliagarivorans marinus]
MLSTLPTGQVVKLTSFDHMLERVLFAMACGLLFIDSLTGFFVMKVGVDLKLSVLYKLLFLFLGLIQLLRRNYSYFLLSFSLMAFVIIWSSLQNLTGGLRYLLFDFGEALKLVSTIIVFLVFSTFRVTNCKKSYLSLMYISLTVLAINIFASLVGYGSSSYGLFGAKGFFYSGNALSGVIVIISTFILVKAAERGILAYISFSVFFVSLSAVIGTKSGILGVAIVASLIPLHRFNFTPKMLAALSVIVPIGIVACYFVYSLFLNSPIYDRLVYFYETGGVTRALLSDRDIFFWDIFPSFSMQGYTRLLFGFGFEELNKFNKDTVEMDPIDIVFIFGFATFFVYIVLMNILFNVVRKFPDKGDKLITDLKLSIGVSSFVLLLISSVAGHILFNGFVTFIWGVTIALPFWRRNNIDYYSSLLTARVGG